MKYKVMGVVGFFTAVIMVFLLNCILVEPESKRYVQHIEEPRTKCERCTGENFCTHLPIIKINTNGKEIPGKPYHDKVEKVTKHTLAEDGSDTIWAKAEIIDTGISNHLTDEAKITGDITIRIRGNSSRHFDKPPYLINFVNSDGTNADIEVMGMDAHHEWAMHGPYLDKTLIRNYMWYNIAGMIMDYAPNVRFCELILNGEYRGVYLMTETITGGKEGARIPLEIDAKRNSFTGYIIRHDRGSENPVKNIEPLSIYTMRTNKKLNIVYPGGKDLNEKLAREIELDFSQIEKALHSYDFDDEEGYKGNMDIESFVDYLIINEVTLNRDAGLYSTYIYKDTDRKYRMCVWDFNNALDNYEEVANPPEGFALHETLWFNRIIQDKDFTQQVIERYKELRKGVLSTEYLMKFIDDTLDYLGPAIDRNYERWGYSFSEEKDRLEPKERNPRSFDEAVSDMKECLEKRLEWMDKNIKSLKQYSAASKTHESHEAHEQ